MDYRDERGNDIVRYGLKSRLCLIPRQMLWWEERGYLFEGDGVR